MLLLLAAPLPAPRSLLTPLSAVHSCVSQDLQRSMEDEDPSQICAEAALFDVSPRELEAIEDAYLKDQEAQAANKRRQQQLAQQQKQKQKQTRRSSVARLASAAGGAAVRRRRSVLRYRAPSPPT